MKAQATVRSINAVQAVTPNLNIGITFNGNQPVVPGQSGPVQRGNTVMWSCSIPQDGTIKVIFSPFGESLVQGSGGQNQHFQFGPFTIAVDPTQRTTYPYRVSFTPLGGAEQIVDPEIIVDPTGGVDQ